MTATLPTPQTPTPDLAAAAAAARATTTALRAMFAERDEEVRALMVAAVACKHVLLLGDPGTAKSALANAFTQAVFQATVWKYLFTKFTVDSEVFGPVSLMGLEHDEYRRVTAGYFPSALCAFLDEIFKANSAILNALLTGLNEREFDNGGQRVKIPLEMAIGASNEMPQEGDGLDALRDRFLLARWVAPIRDRDRMRALMARGTPTGPAPVLPAEHLATLRASARAVVVPDAVLDGLLDIKDQLAQKHSITASDRRWVAIVDLVRAAAALDGRTTAILADLTVAVDALWRAPEDRPKVKAIVTTVAAPRLAAASRIEDAMREEFAKFADLSKESGPSAVDKIARLNRALAEGTDRIRAIDATGTDPDVLAAAERVADMQRTIAQTIASKMRLKF